jgi:hypothetical protein
MMPQFEALLNTLFAATYIMYIEGEFEKKKKNIGILSGSVVEHRVDVPTKGTQSTETLVQHSGQHCFYDDEGSLYPMHC